MKPGHQGVLCTYNAIQQQLVEARNIMLIEAPSRVLSPPINEPDSIDEMENICVINFHHGPQDNDML